LKDLDVSGRVILKWIFKRYNEGSMDWIYLAPDWNTWPALVNEVMNVRIS
jgi:hypothetical protein